MIRTRCVCGEVYFADESHAGEWMLCLRCGRIFPVRPSDPLGARPRSRDLLAPRVQPPSGVPEYWTDRRPVSPRPAKSCLRSALIWASIVVAVVVVAILIAEQEPAPSRRASSPWPAPTRTAAAVLANPGRRLPSDATLPTGSELWSDGRSGLGELTVENGTELDAVVKLVDVGGGRAHRVVSVQSGETATVQGIHRGTFVLRYALGWDLVPSAGTFNRHARYGEFERRLVFDEVRLADGTRYTTYRVTLHGVVDGNARTEEITEAEFLGSDVL